MALRIMNNITATFAQRQIGLNTNQLSRSLERLSSGYRINHAADDAAGLAVSERLRFQIKGLEQAGKNVMDGISMVQVAEGGLQQATEMLQRIRVLAIQSTNGTLANSDRDLLQAEVNQLLSELDRTETTVTFNGVSLLGSAQTITLQVGASSGQTLGITLSQVSSTQLSINTLTVITSAKAASAILQIDSALNTLVSSRANLGAAQNRLENTYDFIGIQRENLMAAESRIRDVDFATEMTNYTKNQILVQASTAMLSQANMAPQSVLQLLG